LPKSLQNDINNQIDGSFDDKYLKFFNDSPFEKVHVKFCKMVMGVRKQTSNLASKAETGRYPLHIEILTNMVKYWLRLNKQKQETLIADALGANLDMQASGIFTWTTMIKHILTKCNFSEIWNNGSVPNEKVFLRSLRHKLQDNYCTSFKQNIHNDIRKDSSANNKLRTYRTFKTDHKQEKYINTIKDSHIRSAVSKLRLSNHHLMIEKGRHLGLKLEQRICNKCPVNEIEDEKHAVMKCTAYTEERNKLFDFISHEFEDWDTIDMEQQFVILMKLNIESIIVKTAKFIAHIVDWDQTTA